MQRLQAAVTKMPSLSSQVTMQLPTQRQQRAMQERAQLLLWRTQEQGKRKAVTIEFRPALSESRDSSASHETCMPCKRPNEEEAGRRG